MIIENVIVHHGISFEDYLQIPRISFSSLKDAPVNESVGMRIGSLVHRYLLKPKSYRYEEADIVIPISQALVSFVGRELIQFMIAEVPVTADFIWEGFRLRWKGVPDLRYAQVVVVDFKVIKEGTLKGYCDRFGYREQIRGYMMPFGVDLGLIIAYNRKTKKVEIEAVDKSSLWWQAVTMSHGEVNKTQVL
jgi:hypothetical protein